MSPKKHAGSETGEGGGKLEKHFHFQVMMESQLSPKSGQGPEAKKPRIGCEVNHVFAPPGGQAKATGAQ